MSRHADCLCYALLAIASLIAASTFGVAYLDYSDQRAEYVERVAINRAFHDRHCLDSGYLAKFPQLVDECHASYHEAFDDPGRRALRDVLGRWSVCDAKGCDAFLDRFGRYFSLASLLLALAVGGFCFALIQRAAAARAIERLPEAMRG